MSKAKKVDRAGEGCTEWCTVEGEKTISLKKLIENDLPIALQDNKGINIDFTTNPQYNSACSEVEYAQKPGNVKWCEKYCQAGGFFSTFKGRQEKVKQFLEKRKIECNLLKKR